MVSTWDLTHQLKEYSEFDRYINNLLNCYINTYNIVHVLTRGLTIFDADFGGFGDFWIEVRIDIQRIGCIVYSFIEFLGLAWEKWSSIYLEYLQKKYLHWFKFHEMGRTMIGFIYWSFIEDVTLNKAIVQWPCIGFWSIWLMFFFLLYCICEYLWQQKVFLL